MPPTVLRAGRHGDGEPASPVTSNRAATEPEHIASILVRVFEQMAGQDDDQLADSTPPPRVEAGGVR